jgi:hypothetical protein
MDIGKNFDEIEKIRKINTAWNQIFYDYKIYEHDFNLSPFTITSKQINKSTKNLISSEARIVCKLDSREDRPEIFIKNNLFILPIKNGVYQIIKGEGYVDIPEILTEIIDYNSELDFKLLTSLHGSSEMQHLDFAFCASLIKYFTGSKKLYSTIRGRKRTEEFNFKVGNYLIETKGVQVEIDGGYEGSAQIVLIEAKNGNTKNLIIRQLYYPFRHWKLKVTKEFILIFFEKVKNENIYKLWEYKFEDPENYNSIHLVKSNRYRIIDDNNKGLTNQ